MSKDEAVIDMLARVGLEELLRLRYQQGLRDGRAEGRREGKLEARKQIRTKKRRASDRA